MSGGKETRSPLGNQDSSKLESKSGSVSESKSKSRKARKRSKRSSKEGVKIDVGEQLTSFEESEWDNSDPAFQSELINLKLNSNKVSVFQTNKINVRETIKEIEVEGDSAQDARPFDKADLLGQLTAKAVRAFLNDKKKENVVLTVKLIDGVEVVDLIEVENSLAIEDQRGGTVIHEN